MLLLVLLDLLLEMLLDGTPALLRPEILLDDPRAPIKEDELPEEKEPDPELLNPPLLLVEKLLF